MGKKRIDKEFKFRAARLAAELGNTQSGIERNLGISQGPQDTLKAIFEYIEVFYNRNRKHSTLGYKTPDQFERAMKSAVCF